MPISPARVRLALALAGLIAWQIHALFRPFATIRAEGAGTAGIEAFAAGVPVGQTFRAATDGLHSAVVEFSTDRPAAIVVAYRVMGWAPAKLDDHWAAVIESTETVELPSGRTRHAFHFSAIPESSRQVYQFQIQQLASRSVDGGAAPEVAVVWSEDSLEEGNVIVGKDQIVDRDLIFAAHGADTRFDDFRMRTSSRLPRALRTAAAQWSIALLLFAIGNWAFAVFAYELIRSAEGREDAKAAR
ncbi:MAG: hypothetical protein IT176_14805 [Acidobacteria bacterium]|nr:hypothetical protein [Acidobacteriota bacterium]